jgi:hypothetical protein
VVKVEIMRIASLIAFSLICIPGFMIGLPLFVHLITWPFEESKWPVNAMLFLADLAIVAAILTQYKKQLRFRSLIAWVAFFILCVPIVYVCIFTKGKVIDSPFFVLPSLGFIVMYIWSLVKPSTTASKQLFQKECCKEA